MKTSFVECESELAIISLACRVFVSDWMISDSIKSRTPHLVYILNDMPTYPMIQEPFLKLIRINSTIRIKHFCHMINYLNINIKSSKI